MVVASCRLGFAFKTQRREREVYLEAKITLAQERKADQLSFSNIRVGLVNKGHTFTTEEDQEHGESGEMIPV
jgi:hypothetical protein